VLIAPYTYIAYPLWMHTRVTSTSSINHMASTLTGRGYQVKELLDAKASIKAIVDVLKSSPGYVLFNTHGDSGGNLETSESVTAQPYLGQSAIEAATLQESHRLISEGLKSLVDYHTDMGKPTTFVLEDDNCSWLTSACSYTVSVTPMFWSWLTQQQHASFAKSLVFMAACLTDTTSYLRDAVHARAYFAFSKVTSSDLATAVAKYLATSLARPTHSPEEAFYNMLRVQTTKMMIYSEDLLLNKQLGQPGSTKSLTGNLAGWGWNGATLVNYRQAGWKSPSAKLDQGQTWWMLFAGRWDTNAQDGAAALTYCLDTYWLNGQPGGLADPYCNAANAGQLSNKVRLQNDVAYAEYLLIGQDPTKMGFPTALVVPRWTMDDGG
jgi:hypothetical protein